MFVGYAQPYLQIRYELDFTRGAEVDIGCGTSVVGNGALDTPVSMQETAHPLSMREPGYYWPGAPDISKENPGFYPSKCPRYHRFKVTSPGNFSFDACASTSYMGLGLFKRTDNLTESEPRMTGQIIPPLLLPPPPPRRRQNVA